MVGARRAARSDFLDSTVIDRLYENARPNMNALKRKRWRATKRPQRRFNSWHHRPFPYCPWD